MLGPWTTASNDTAKRNNVYQMPGTSSITNTESKGNQYPEANAVLRDKNIVNVPHLVKIKQGSRN